MPGFSHMSHLWDACGYRWYFLFADGCSIVWTHHSLFIHSTVDWHLSSLQSMAIIKSDLHEHLHWLCWDPGLLLIYVNAAGCCLEQRRSLSSWWHHQSYPSTGKMQALAKATAPHLWKWTLVFMKRGFYKDQQLRIEVSIVCIIRETWTAGHREFDQRK